MLEMAPDKLLARLPSRVWGTLEWLGVTDSIQGHYFLEARADELTYAPELFVQLGYTGQCLSTTYNTKSITG